MARPAVFCPYRVAHAACEHFVQDVAAGEHDSVFPVNIKLRVRNLLAQTQLVSVDVLDFNCVCLVAASPNDEISVGDVLTLKLRSRCLDKADSSLPLVHDVEVESLGVATQPSERVDIAVLVLHFRAFSHVKLGVAGVSSLFHAFKENFNPLSVQDLDANSLGKSTDFFIEAPVAVEPELFAEAQAEAFFFAATFLFTSMPTAC